MFSVYRRNRYYIAALAGASICYAVLALAFISTSPDIGLRCLLESADTPHAGAGLTIQGAVRSLDDCKGYSPEVGDVLVQIHDRRIRTLVDFVQAQADLRDAVVDPVFELAMGADPSELRRSTLSLVKYPDQSRLVRIRFHAPDETRIREGWLWLHGQPSGGVLASLIWSLVQSAIVAIAAFACWKRPYDRTMWIFFNLTALTLIAYVGGSHWWVIAGSMWLTLPFLVAAVLLPVVLLHFFVVFPDRTRMLHGTSRWGLAAMYAIPVFVIVVGALLILFTWWASRLGAADGPFADIVSQWTGGLMARLLGGLRIGIYAYMLLAAGYFALSVGLIVRSLFRTQDVSELGQVRWLLAGSLAGAIPVAYTLYLAYFDRAAFALGAGRLPMWLASIAFMLAYAVGIARYKLAIVDEVINRGMRYYLVSTAVTLTFSVTIALGAFAAWRKGPPLFGHHVAVVIVLALSVVGLFWLRDRVQQMIDRRFFREKYQLNRALSRVNRAVSGLVEQGAVADDMLASCCEVLRVDRAGLYMRGEGSSRFRLVDSVGTDHFPQTIEADGETLSLLDDGTSLQRAPGGHPGPQRLLRTLQAELVHGLTLDGELTGLVALGAKPGGGGYTAEDATFLTAVSRLTGVALHCAKVHGDITRLNEDLQLKIDKISEQSRQIELLQGQLAGEARPRELAATSEFRRDGIKGNSPAMQQVLATVRKVAGSESSVLIRGESGTGKELLAKAIHDNSDRRDGPLVTVHCAALSPSLLESELFGHVKGAFTDAREDKIGRFALADGGSLFLDEIGDVSLDVQVKLLRVLQERTFEPVGGSRSMTVDVRLIAATHQNLERLIAAGKFREDLYYRLNVITVTLPPLRERRDDIFELAVHFLRRATERSGKRIVRITDEALESLRQYDWPGNIRELQNVMERAVVLAEGEQITIGDLPVEVQVGRPRRLSSEIVEVKSGAGLLTHHEPPRQATATRRSRRRDPMQEQAELQAALDQADGNKAEAARLLGLPRSTFYSKLKKFGLG